MLIKAALALTLALPTVGAPDPACWDTAWRCRDVNEVRADNGRPPLDQLNSKLLPMQDQADKWSETMAGDGVLRHASDLGVARGEIVGYGPDFLTVMAGFAGSPEHTSILLDREWSQVGIGFTRVDGRVWICVRFR